MMVQDMMASAAHNRLFRMAIELNLRRRRDLIGARGRRVRAWTRHDLYFLGPTTFEHAIAHVVLGVPSEHTIVPPVALRAAVQLASQRRGGPALIVAPYLFGGFVTLLGVLFIVQTLRIRFVFDDEAFEVKTLDLSEGLDGALGDTGENFAVGGENRWAYSSFVNWEFFPTQSFPILVYFKETATPQDKWAVGPGQFANSDDALAKGAVQGQVHFFPCIGNADQLRDEFIKNGCAKL